MARTKGSKIVDGKHLQHSKKFLNELNSINKKIEPAPFRISDEKWIIGKYKNIKISDTPKNYINWVLNNFNLSENHYSILKKYV